MICTDSCRNRDACRQLPEMFTDNGNAFEIGGRHVQIVVARFMRGIYNVQMHVLDVCNHFR